MEQKKRRLPVLFCAHTHSVNQCAQRAEKQRLVIELEGSPDPVPVLGRLGILQWFLPLMSPAILGRGSLWPTDFRCEVSGNSRAAGQFVREMESLLSKSSTGKAARKHTWEK